MVFSRHVFGEILRLSYTGLAVTGALSANSATVSKNQDAYTEVVIDNQNSGDSAGVRLKLDAYGGGWSFDMPKNATYVNPLIAKFGGVEKYRYDPATSTFAVTGALSATGYVGTGNDAGSGATTVFASNTDGRIYVGKGGSGGNDVLAGNSPYAGVIGTNSNAPLQFGTNNVIRATIDTAGNLGLGVVPSAWGSSYKAIDINNIGSLMAETYGNVGIAFNTYYPASEVPRYKNSLGATSYRLTGASHEWYTAPSGTAGDPITFTQAMTLDASGNLLVGTTSAYGRLHVAQSNASQSGIWNANSAKNQSAINTYSILTGTGNKNTFAAHFGAFTEDTNVFFVYGNGNVINTNNSYGALSDIKLKQDITDCTPKLEKLNQVRVVNYRLKSDPDHKQLGVIAQELEEIFPGMIEESPDYIEVKKTRIVDVPAVFEERVISDGIDEIVDEEGNVIQEAVDAVTEQVEVTPATTREEEYTEREATGEVTKSVKYSVFVPMLIKGLQEQSAIIAAMEARLSALEAA